MKSILLDERKNARLLYFAPTSDKGGVGEEQFQEDKNKDVQAFKDIAYEVFKHGRKKIASDIQKSVTMEEIKTTLMSLLRQSDIKWWTASSNMNTTKIKCDICCVNKPEMFYKKLQHDQSCVTKIQMCVGCLWNWRYNPVKCHSCDQGKIQSPVGDSWGAILIAGTDDKHDVTQHFEDDIGKMKDTLITEATLMGVWNNVFTVKTSTTTHSEQLEKAFSNIDTPEINTLVLVYSGHHGEEGFRIDSDLLTDDALENKINGLKHVKKVILFLDCCFPKKLNLGDKTVLQFNAVKREQKASSGRTGSQFINEIVDALTKSWKCGCCQNSPIIRHFDLQEYLSRHANSDSTEPSHQTYTAGEIDVILTFRAVDSGWLTALEKSLESDPIQELKKELVKLYKTTSTVSIRLDIDEALEKIYEEPKLTFKRNGKDEEDHISELNNIFLSKDGKIVNTVFVVGEPGSGKSSLCKKIIHDWCKTEEGNFGQSGTEWHDISSQFEFVFFLSLREAKNECKIKNMILKNVIDRMGLGQESVVQDILLGDILKSNSCLLLLDGLDEWQHPEQCNWNERIPHVDTSWENCTILITTRPYKLAELKIGNSQIDNHVMLRGVTYPMKLVEKIVSRLNEFNDTKTPLDPLKCIQGIQDENLWHFSECPIVLAHIVWLWYKRKLSANMKHSDLYGTLLKERWLEYCGKSSSSSRSKFNDVISALSKIAFKKYFADDDINTIVFEIDEEDKTTFESQKAASLESGILSCFNVPGDHPQYHFLHKTFQEYLAALFISEQIAESCLHIKHIYEHHRRESGLSLSQIFLFLCGLSTKAAEDLSKTMNELFTHFCDKECYSEEDSYKLQDMILQGQIELDKDDDSGGKLCLQHMNLGRFYRLKGNKATILEQYMTKNQSSIVSLYIGGPSTVIASPLASRRDRMVLDLENCKDLKFFHLCYTGFKDVIGLNLSNLVECGLEFKTRQQAPNLTSTFYNSDINCLKNLRKFKLSNLTDLSWLHEGSEQEECLDLRRLENLQHLTELELGGLSTSDVVHLQLMTLHKLSVGFLKLNPAQQLMATLSAHGTCQNEREGLFSHLKHVCLENVRMPEEQFIRLLQSCIHVDAESSTCELVTCFVEPDENVEQLQAVFEQQVTPSNCATSIQLVRVDITAKALIRLVDIVTRCGHPVKCELHSLKLRSNQAVEQPNIPIVVPQPISADYTSELNFFNIQMSTEQICQIVGIISHLNHSVTLRIHACSEILNENNYLMNQMVPPQYASLTCAKYINVQGMDISENTFWYIVSSVIQFGLDCGLFRCTVLPNGVPHADKLHFLQVGNPHLPAHTAKIRLNIVSIPQDVVQCLACLAVESEHLVECKLNTCEIPFLSDDRPLKEKMDDYASLMIQEFVKVDPTAKLPERFNADQTWDIRFKATPKIK
ncbi:uncharacterized protein LOC128221926 isoform X2 [Mya arenaria]|nr:uncharacterized protein LOC128221926 isoform X2 [Mya arenaria]